ncbi:MAG TPA: type II secretion system protein N [Woeseiaceae bacterium]|nr:type II secretion system protein N [Woeseiaceae bacterium]
MTKRRLLLVGFATCLLGIVVLFPARVAYRWFAPASLVLSGISGSIWRGTAAAGMVSNVYVRNLTWRFKPGRLPRGEVAYAVEALPAGGFLDGRIGINFGGSLMLSQLRVSLPLSMLDTATGISGLRGTANASLDQMTLSGGLPVSADGSVDVAGLVLPIVAPEPLGNFRAEFQTGADGNIVANVQDTQAVIDIAGRLLLRSDRAYEFLGRIAATDDTPESVRKQLQFLGSPNERGQYELRLEGQL